MRRFTFSLVISVNSAISSIGIPFFQARRTIDRSFISNIFKLAASAFVVASALAF